MKTILQDSNIVALEIPPSIKDLVRYDPETGLFHRRIASSRGPIGSVVGGNTKGYTMLWVDGAKYSAHRVAWFLFYGEPALQIIDHVNGDKSDNRIVNLRLSDTNQNHWNKTKSKNNTSGFKGVGYHKSTGMWQAQIMARKSYSYLGLFPTAEEAHQAYRDAAIKLHGEFARFE